MTKKLIGRTRGEIERALAGKSREELLDLIYRLVTFEPLLTARQIANTCHVAKRDVLREITQGKFVDPVLGPGFFTRGGNSKKVTISAANAWRASYFVPVSPSAHKICRSDFIEE